MRFKCARDFVEVAFLGIIERRVASRVGYVCPCTRAEQCLHYRQVARVRSMVQRRAAVLRIRR